MWIGYENNMILLAFNQYDIWETKPRQRIEYSWSNIKHSSNHIDILARAICIKVTWTQLRKLGLYSLSGKTSYRQISWSLEAARLCVIMIVPH